MDDAGALVDGAGALVTLAPRRGEGKGRATQGVDTESTSSTQSGAGASKHSRGMPES